MSNQLHKNFTDDQVKSLLKSYIDKEIKLNYILQILHIKRSRFFELLTRYRKDPDNFSIQYKRNISNYRIDREIEANIIKELKSEKDLIKAKDVPIRYYNYSFIKDLLEQKYSQRASLPTIIERAKKNNFYFSTFFNLISSIFKLQTGQWVKIFTSSISTALFYINYFP